MDFIRSFKTGIDIGEDFITPTYSSANFSIRHDPLYYRPTTTALPYFEFAKRLYAAQYVYIGSIFSFTSPETFEQNLREMYNREPDFSDLRDRLNYCQILIILAFGQMYSVNQWTSNDGPPGFEFFQQAMYLLPDIHERPSVTFVEVLSLIGYFFQNLNRRDAAFLYVRDPIMFVEGFMLTISRLDWLCVWLYRWVCIRKFRMRHLMTKPANIDDVYGGQFIVWIGRDGLPIGSTKPDVDVGRILCVKSGNPLTIADQDIGVHPPSRLVRRCQCSVQGPF